MVGRRPAKQTDFRDRSARLFLSRETSAKGSGIRSFSLLSQAFLGYMVVDRNVVGLAIDELSRALVADVSGLMTRDRLLRDCNSLLFEVEDPRYAPRPKQLHHIARIQRFCSLAATQRFTLRAFDVNYLQPALTLPDGNADSEQPLLLISARNRQGNGQVEIQKELQEILDFIYYDLYPEGFSDIPEELQAYRAYCSQLHDRVLKNLPAKIPIINPAHLTCARTARRANRRTIGNSPKAQS